jgi:hypothetical protein
LPIEAEKENEMTFSVRLDPKTEQDLERIAKSLERKRGDALRVIIRQRAQELNSRKEKTASTSSLLAGGEVDAGPSTADFMA